jgi:uncharacterized membrane protein
VDLIRKYFISPIWDRTGYNWVNTLVYGIILGIAAIIVHRSVRRTGYRFNLDLFVMFVPYLVLATAVRTLVDSGRYPYTYLLVSPGIYFMTMGIFAFAILIGLLVKRFWRTEVKKTVLVIGIILGGWQLAFVLGMAKRPLAGLLIVCLSSAVCGAVLLLRRLWPKRLRLLQSRENVLVVCCHLIDATVTFVGIDLYDYAEQHILPRTLIGLTGTASVMYLLKITALPVVLYLLDKYVEDQEMNSFIKMVVMVLGLAPATRNFLRIVIAS